MTKTIEAVFDGEAFRPDAPVEIPPNTRVRLTIESLANSAAAGAFLRTARALELSGPRDWSTNLEAYLHGQKADRER